MSTVEDFENAPFGATATRDGGGRAMKMFTEGEPRWVTRGGSYLDDETVVQWGFTLDAPTTAREALDLAWDLAHEVKEGQHLPEGSQYLELSSSGVKEYTVWRGVDIVPGIATVVRTLEPLPEPEPDWLDAPAVLARTDNDQFLRVWSAHKGDLWASTSHTYTRRWQNLRDVTPLYPKEGQES